MVLFVPSSYNYYDNHLNFFERDIDPERTDIQLNK